MSIVAAPIVNNSLVKPLKSVCYDNNYVNSQGLFIGEDPLSFSLPLLLLELSIIFIVSNAMHYILKPLGQSRMVSQMLGLFIGEDPLSFSLPLLLLELSIIFIVSNAMHFILKPLGQSRMVSQMLTGILMGPSLLGRSWAFRSTVFPVRGTYILDTISMVSLILFLFSIGVKTDLSLLRRPGWRAVAVGIGGSFLPLALALIIYFTMRDSLPEDLAHGTLLFGLSLRLSFSSFPVIGDALQELGFLNTELGRIALSASLITDFCNWIALCFITAIKLMIRAKSLGMAIARVACLAAFIIFVVFVARPMSMWAIRRTPTGELVKEGVFVTMIVAALLTALSTEVIGYHSILGPAVLGLSITGGMPIGVTLSERLDSFLSGLLLPLYLVLSGLRTDFTDLGEWATWGTLELIVMACFIGKLVGSALAALYFKMPLKDALILGLMTNIKGIIEVSFINNSGDNEVATAQHFSVLTINLLAITAVTSPLVKFLYNPNVRYVFRKRRTVEHMKPDADFRVLVAVECEDDVPPLIDLLDALNPHPSSPLNLFLLHLTELSGNAAAILRPYRLRPREACNPSLTDHIVAAFRHFADGLPHGSLQIHPFISASPPATMHNDVCSLALHRKVRLAVIPFHRPLAQRVMDHAPCSVAVLVTGERTLTSLRTNMRVERAAVVFLGGEDDREAAAIGGRMAGGGVGLTMVRVRGKGEPAMEEDEKAVDRVRGEEGVEYMEKVVGDGEGTVGVVRGMGERFDVVVVGKRKGTELEGVATKGIEEWSQCPELGVLGDMLAASEVGGKVAILVVQQQQWTGCCEGAGEEARDGLTRKMTV